MESSTYHRTPARESVQVFLGDPDLDPDSVALGSVAQASSDPRVTVADRRAMRAVATSIESIHARFGYGGFDDASGAIRIVLHYHKGPESSYDYKLRLPQANPFDEVPGAKPRANVILPADAAYHELIHAVQSQLSGHTSGVSGEARGMGADVRTPAEAKGVREGIADAFTALDTRSWQTGARYFQQDGGVPEVARDFEHPRSKHALMQVDTTFDAASFGDPSVDPHATGGVVVATARSLQQQLGWERAQDVMWSVLQDPDFQRSAQTWHDLANAFTSVADAGDSATADAIHAALRSTQLDSAAS
jgi:hypothetical protein